MGVYPGVVSLGGEGAGVVLEVGEGVSGVVVGDRVLGVLAGSFGPVAVADERLFVGVPGGWSWAQAATVPIAFLTAYYALTEIARLKRGEVLVIHGAAGGVGMAAVQIARYIGAEVFATAHPDKWGTLAGLGIDDRHVASSRSLEFAAAFAGEGVDVVLNSLSGEFVDASLGLLGEGGRFVGWARPIFVTGRRLLLLTRE